MSVSKDDLKAYFEQGDRPQSDNYNELIDAVVLANPEQVTMNTIKSWLASGGGPKGEFVRFPFRTIYDQPVTGTSKTATAENMIGYMVTESKLAPFIMSEEYPQDIIKFDASYASTPVTATVAEGKILYREDTVIRVGADMDWRKILVELKWCQLGEFGMKATYATMASLLYAGALPSTVGAENGTAVNPQFASIRDNIVTATTAERLMFGNSATADGFENVYVRLFSGFAEFVLDSGLPAALKDAEFPAFYFHAPDSSTYDRKDIDIRGAYGVFGDEDGTTQVRNFKGTFYGGYHRSLDQGVSSERKIYDALLITHPECKRFVGEGAEQKHIIYDGGTTAIYYDGDSGEANVLAGGRLYNSTKDEYAHIVSITTGSNLIVVRGDFSHWENDDALTYSSTQLYYDNDVNESLLIAGDVITNDSQVEQADLITINTSTNLIVVNKDVTATWVNNDNLSTSYKAFTADIHNVPAGPTAANFSADIHNAPAAPTYTAGNEAEDKFTTGISANNNYFNGYNFIYDNIETTKSLFEFVKRIVFNGIIKQMSCSDDLEEIIIEAPSLIERVYLGALPANVKVFLYASNPTVLSSANPLGSRIIDDTIDIRDDISEIKCYNRVIEYIGLSTKTPVPTGAVTVKCLTPATNENFMGRTNWTGINVTSGVVQAELDEADAQDLAGVLTVLGTRNVVRTNNNVNATLAWQRTGNDIELLIAHAGADNGTFHMPFYMRIGKVT